jgi:hypothetical protein
VWDKYVDKVGGSQERGLASPVVPGVPVDVVVACLVAEEGEDGVEDKEEDEAVLVRGRRLLMRMGMEKWAA